MNKIGKTNNALMWGVGIVVVLVLMGVINVGGIFGGEDDAIDYGGQAPIDGTVDCNTAPSLGFSVVNALVKGTAANTLETVRLNGVLQTPGVVPSAFQYGDNVEILYNATNYIDMVGPTKTVKCGLNTISQEVYATDSPTVRLFNTDGNRIGDSVNANCILNDLANQSESASGISLKMEVQSAPLESTGDLVMVVEYINNTEVGFSDITVSGTGVTDGQVLSTYTQNSTASTVRAFNVPASVNGALTTYYINIAPKATRTLGEGATGTYALVSFYSKQAFIDIDGTFKVGIEDANGNTKYEDLTDHGICITN